MNKGIFVLLVVFLFPVVFAVSGESINASEALNQARLDFNEMREREVLLNRANESYQEALQLYDAQMALEMLDKKARFDLVLEYAAKVSAVKDAAFSADDELGIFLEVIAVANESSDLSGMSEEYNEVLLSFEEERFEDTAELINGAYLTLSEIQSSQTTLNLLYKTTSESIGNFFRTQWKKILISICVAVFVFLVFWKAISRIMIRLKVNNLILRKSSINQLIKKLQHGYFTAKTIPTSSYHIKLKKFENMILDINRQLPSLREDMIKLQKDGSKSLRVRKKVGRVAGKRVGKKI